MDDQLFRQIMRELPAPVIVLTAFETPGHWRGMTASSMVSVSLKPPLLSVNVTRESQMHEVMERATHYTFNVLGEGQEGLAMHFAQAGLTTQEQAVGEGVVAGKTPLGGVSLGGVAAWVHCKAFARFGAGDHTVFIGEVLEGNYTQGATPLLYHQRRFRVLG